MKFKNLSVYGFKSFAVKTSIGFTEGITAIVGPNGCGKSNVADAVRWVLGEQSAKLLRGDNMQDVIFKGTEKRGALSYAEVSLTFDNTDRCLFPSCEYSEVVMTRKLFRDGESQYLLNGNICRLRDVGDMLRDAGFGREGYTIIGQGKVTEIVSSKPEDRRAIFEEAAGISKYKYRKLEAERKNERTKANIDRINDAMKIEQERLEPLTKQAEKARMYLELSEKLKQLEINDYIYQFDTAADKKDKLGEVIDGFKARIAEKQAEYEKANSDFNSAHDKLQTIDVQLDEFRRELTDISVNSVEIRGQIQYITRERDAINDQNNKYIADNAELEENCRELDRMLDERRAEHDAKTNALETHKAEFDKTNVKYTELDKRVAEEENRIEGARRALLDAMERKARVSQSVGELTAERALLIDQSEGIRSRIESTTERLAEVKAAAEKLENRLAILTDEKTELTDKRADVSQKLDACSTRLRSLGESISEMQSEYSGASVRRNMLKEIHASMEGYSLPVRKLLDDAKTDNRIKNSVLGVVGQVISVKEGFETAIEISLGQAMSNIVTKTEDDAKILIDHLKKNRYGRATFLPITSFKKRSIEKQYMPLLNRSGCFGIATEVISADPIFDTIISGLLGGTVIVDNMDTAVKLARDSDYAFRIVTLDGEMLVPAGSITGGSKKSDVGSVFSHERELKEITARCDELKSALDAMQTEQAELDVNNKKYTVRLKELTEDIQNYVLAENSANIEYKNLTVEITELETAVKNDESALENMTERKKAIDADIELAEKTKDELGTDRQTEEDDRSRREFEAVKFERDKLRDAVNEGNLAILSLGKDIERLTHEITRLDGERVATLQNIEANNMAILSNNRSIAQLNEKLDNLAASNADNSDERYAELNEKLNNTSKYKADLNRLMVDSEKLRMQINEEITELINQKNEHDTALALVDSNMETMRQRVTEEYGLTHEECLERKDENYNPETGRIEIGKLRRRIDHLGNINIDAIAESQELAQSFHNREIQRDDLVKSLRDEERVIGEMNANMLRDFNACFEQIRTNFRSIFSELFNGGTADLELTENDDELLRGVEIKAQPPSKTFGSISLLSGGEKTLTAIAILFAILRLRPMPFCLLDEIEAALDDANVGRFAAYLKKFSKDTQFIVITHRKPTMEQADTLFGVTMEEKGVSKIVSVQLTDAIKQAAAGNEE